MIDKNSFYNFDKLYGYNATYNFVVGARGLGKTYGSKKKVINDFLTKGDQFIYLRRFKTELKGRVSFFADIADQFPGYIFRVDGNEAQVAKDTGNKKTMKFETMGYFLALSSGQSNKSVAYPKVKTIIFDEFIKDDNRYLPEEANRFNDFYSTVDRWQDRVRVLFLANAVTIMNPYFIAFDIIPDGEEWLRLADGFIVCHFPDDEGFRQEVFKTKFGRFIKNNSPEYAEYSVGNIFMDNSDNMIGLKTPEASYYATLETAEGQFSIWTGSPWIYIQEKRPKKEIMFTMLPGNVRPDMPLMLKTDPMMKHFNKTFRQGHMVFDKPKTRNVFIKAFK